MSLGLVGGLIGAGIGSFFGAASIGFSIGSSLFGLLEKPDTVETTGPRLNDLNVQTSSYGVGIPIVYGTMALAGNVIWLKGNKLDEVTTETESGGGKGGGPTQSHTSYEYYASFAVLLCEGEITGVRKIWADSTLIYNVEVGATPQTVYTSNSFAHALTIYTGNATQEADPLIQADKGAANTPAYRDRAYIVFDTLALEKFGNRIPNIRCEVVKDGSVAVQDFLYYKQTGHPETYDGAVFTSIDEGVVRLWDGVETNSSAGVIGIVDIIDIDGNHLGQEGVGGRGIDGSDPYPVSRYSGIGNWQGTPHNWQSCGFLGDVPIYWDSQNASSADLPHPAGDFKICSFPQNVCIPFDPILDDPCDYPIGCEYTYYVDQSEYVVGISFSTDHQRMCILTGNSHLGSSSGHWYMFDENHDLIDSGVSDYTNNPVSLGLFGDGHASPYSKASGFGINVMENDYTHFWMYYAPAGFLWGWIIKDDIFQFDKAYTTTSVQSGTFQSHTMIADSGLCMIAGEYAPDNTGWIAAWSRNDVVTQDGDILSNIVTHISGKAELTSDLINVTALTDMVDGYMIPRPTTARSAIEPLQKAFFFDATESDDKVKFVKRGGAVLASVTDADLGATQSANNEPLLEITRKQELELPREVDVQYVSPDYDYQQGQQRSRRLATQSVQKVITQIPVSMTHDKAKQISEILHYNAWQERESFQFSLPPRFAYLEPTDILHITSEGNVHTVRITEMDASPGGFIKFRGVADRASDYTNDATGEGGAFSSSTVQAIGPTNLQLLDLPLLTNTGDEAAIYVAAAGYFSGWTGAVILRSTDEGASYGTVGAIATGATIGIAGTALPDAHPDLWDDANTLNVSLQSGSLSSDTEVNVLAGANAAAYGSHGRWEIIQWKTATLEADGTYTLSRLLRARKGTEAHTGDHAAMDTFIVLNINSLANIETVLNTERLYKGVSFGNVAANAYSKAFTNAGERLECLAPYHFQARRDTSNDISMTWLRRSRYTTAAFWNPQVFEASESYELDVYNSANGSAIRTIATAVESATYSSALQVTDFGSVQASVTVKVFQLSATVGRGHVLEEVA